MKKDTQTAMKMDSAMGLPPITTEEQRALVELINRALEQDREILEIL